MSDVQIVFEQQVACGVREQCTLSLVNGPAGMHVCAPLSQCR